MVRKGWRLVWKAGSLYIFWLVWKARNGIVFRDEALAMVRKGWRLVWKAGSLYIFWLVWKARNGIVFSDEALSIQKLKLSFVNLLCWRPIIFRG